MMPSIRSLLVGAVLLARLSSSVIISEPPVSDGQENAEAASELQAFKALLDQVDPPALHAALHRFDPRRFRHGVFDKDVSAAEAVHRDAPAIAKSLVAPLVKRQGEVGNSSVASATTTIDTTLLPPPASTSAVPSDSAQPSDSDSTSPAPSATPSTPVASPTPSASLPSTAADAQTTMPADSSSMDPEDETSATGTSSDSDVASASITTGPEPVVTRTDSTGSVFMSTLTAGQVITTTNADGYTIVSTVDGGVVTLGGGRGSATRTAGSFTTSPSGSRASARPSSTTQLAIRTSTLPGGEIVTLTSQIVVQASGGDEPTMTQDSTPSQTSSVAGGLQSGLAPRSRSFGWEAVGVLGGAVGFAMAL